MKIFNQIKKWNHRRTYKNGDTITRFIAPDIRRDVKIIDVSKIEKGFITAHVRTWNVLYVVNKMNAMPDFSGSQLLKIDALWVWSGENWGGAIPPSDP